MAKKVTVTWTDPSPTTNVDHLEIWRKTGVGGTYAQIGGDISLAAANTYEDTNGGAGLTDSTTYYYQVRAYAADGTTYESIEANITISAVTIAAPTSLAVGTPTDTTIPLTWTKSTTGVMTAYRVYDDGVLLQTFAGDVAAGTLTGLTASTTYTNLTVRAYNGTSESASSNAVNGTTAAAGATPMDFTLTNVTKSGEEYTGTVTNWNGFMTPVNSTTGDFDFEMALTALADQENAMMWVTNTGAAAKFNAAGTLFGIIVNTGGVINKIGAAGVTTALSINTPTTATFGAGHILHFRRVGSTFYIFYNSTQIHQFTETTANATCYLHCQPYTTGDKIVNPRLTML